MHLTIPYFFGLCHADNSSLSIFVSPDCFIVNADTESKRKAARISWLSWRRPSSKCATFIVHFIQATTNFPSTCWVSLVHSLFVISVPSSELAVNFVKEIILRLEVHGSENNLHFTHYTPDSLKIHLQRDKGRSATCQESTLGHSIDQWEREVNTRFHDECKNIVDIVCATTKMEREWVVQ